MTHLTLPEILPGCADYGPIPEKTDRMAAVYLGENTVLTRLWSGHAMIVYTGDMIVMPHLINLGVNEPHVTRTLISLIRPGDRFVDAGANIGYFSILAGWRVYPGGEVWSFEPNPNIYPILASNITNNGFEHCTQRRKLALSDRTGAADLRIFKGYEATSTIRALSDEFVTHTRNETGRDSYAVDVAVDTLDAQMAAVPAIDLMKIDVEGHELSVIRGAVDILRRSPTVKVVMEFVPPILGAGPAAELIALVRSLGFSIYRIEHDGTFTAQNDDHALAATEFADLLLIRQTAPTH